MSRECPLCDGNGDIEGDVIRVIRQMERVEWHNVDNVSAVTAATFSRLLQREVTGDTDD